MPTVEGNNTTELSQDIDEMLASLSPQGPMSAEKVKDQRKAPRYRVKWQGVIVTDGSEAFHGFINDISTQSASIYLNANLPTVKATLHFQVAPLTSTSKPHTMAVSGKIVYSVYDGIKQLYRIAISFLRFHQESDSAFLDQRLRKHHIKIPELDTKSRY